MRLTKIPLGAKGEIVLSETEERKLNDWIPCSHRAYYGEYLSYPVRS